MPNVKSIKVFYTDIGLDLYGLFQDDDTGALLDDIDGAFRATPSSAYIHFTDCSSATPAIPGKYIIEESRTDWGTRNVTGYTYSQLSSGTGNENPTTDDKVSMKLLTIVNDTLIDNSKLALETTVLTRASSATTETILTETQSHPTLVEIEASTILAKEATLNSKASSASVDAIPTNPLLTNDSRLDNLDIAISTRLSSASGDTIDNIASSASSILNMIDGDNYIDITTTPWEEIVKQKGTSTVLIRKKLYDKDGTAITAITQIIGQKMES